LEGSGKPGWLEIRFYTYVFRLSDDVNITGGSVHTIKENTENLIVANKETGLEVNSDKIKYLVMSRDQNAR